MKKGAIVFLQGVIVAFGIGVLVLMLWEPHLEGRNAGATLFQIYFQDPFLAYAYAASAFFFAALFQAWKLLGLIANDALFSKAALRALRIIRFCALVLIASVGGALGYAFLFVRGEDDITGGVAIGLAMILASVIVTAGASVFENIVASRLKAHSMGPR